MSQERLLREHIRLVLERIRPRRTGETTLRFDVREFRSLTTFKELNTYARKRLEFLRSGSSRATYVVNSRQVLKVAFNNDGVLQNENEVKAYAAAGNSGLLTRVFDHDPNYTWIIAEYVRELRDSEELERETGFSGKQLTAAAFRARQGEQLDDDFLASIGDLVVRTGIDPYELYPAEHWGKTADGRLVLLDYGL